MRLDLEARLECSPPNSRTAPWVQPSTLDAFAYFMQEKSHVRWEVLETFPSARSKSSRAGTGKACSVLPESKSLFCKVRNGWRL